MNPPKVDDLDYILVVTKDGQPVEFFLTPGAHSDVECLDLFDFDLPPG